MQNTSPAENRGDPEVKDVILRLRAVGCSSGRSQQLRLWSSLGRSCSQHGLGIGYKRCDIWIRETKRWLHSSMHGEQSELHRMNKNNIDSVPEAAGVTAGKPAVCLLYGDLLGAIHGCWTADRPSTMRPGRRPPLGQRAARPDSYFVRGNCANFMRRTL